LDIGLKQGTDRGHLWNYATSMNRRIDPHSKTHGVLKSLSFVGFDKLVAVTLGAIRMFNLASGEPTGESMPHKKCNIAAVSRDGKTIVSGDDDGQIFVWTALTGSKRRRIKSHTAAVSRLEFSEDGKQFASAGADQTMRIWDVGTGKMRRTWSGSWKSTLALKFLPGDNGLMAVNDYDGEGKVQLGVFAAERSLSEYPIAEDVRCADIARDGTSIATGHFSGKIRLWGFTS
jgi:WD40 repeat protein